MGEKKHTTVNRMLSKVNMFGMYILGGVFVVFMIALLLVQANVQYSMRAEAISIKSREELIDLKREQATWQNQASRGVLQDSGERILLVFEEEDATSADAKKIYIPMLDQMKETYDVLEVDDFEKADLYDYGKIIMAITNYFRLSESIYNLKVWVRNGGNLMVAYPPEISGSFQSLYEILGIKDVGDAIIIDGLHFNDDFMIGGSAHDFPILDAFESSLGVSLQDDCEVLVQSTSEYHAPVIWRKTNGDGTVVVDNFGILDKAYRGIHCAAYSLLGDYCAYPVINAATFYIDDFPSPVPEGDGTYITRDYNISISEFYSQVWWNDVYNLGKKYGIPYTGLIIENYSDQVRGEFMRNHETNRFLYFGNMLLQRGGEIGIHGYNHMPLVLNNFDYEDQYDSYIQWPSREDISNSLTEVFGFTKDLFPQEQLQVYVPPSNILSEEGREVLGDTTIRSIASVYIPGDLAYEQEFDVSEEDGIVNTPRIISGYVINEYMELLALSELNFHYVSTHFQHPDDVLDEDRGAALGWQKLYDSFSGYLEWLYESAPDIRNLTGSELAGAVQRYDLLGVRRNNSDEGYYIYLDNFDSEAWMLLRINNGKRIDQVSGASYKEVGEDLFLLECTEDKISISFKGEGN